MSGQIFQFGTSRFLQAHVALFAHEARAAGQAVDPITVVQTTGDATRSNRVAAFNDPRGYPVKIRGMDGAKIIDRTVQVTSIARGLSCTTDWDAIKTLFAEQASFVISNTGETGYQLHGDDAPAHDGVAPRSFPAKLGALLCRRFQVSGAPLVVLPCELKTRNGQALKAAVVRSARDGHCPEGFLPWLDGHVTFADTLVDRIVSEPIEPIGAVAEPYALWAIQKTPGLCLPFTHPSLVLTENLEPYERLKLHILNLGHTCLAEIWATESRDANETVRDILADPAIAGRLNAIYHDEVLPGFVINGMGDAARAYVNTTLSRFRNPFLEHRLSDIAQHHAQKVERRITSFLDWAAQAGDPYPTPFLTRLSSRYAQEQVDA